MAETSEPRSAWLAFPLTVFLASRAWMFLVAGISLALRPAMFVGDNYDVNVFESLCRWDCVWYMHVARDGYDQAWLSNFFPLFPLFARALHVVFPAPYQTVMVVAANLAGAGALVVIYRVFRTLSGEPAARGALVLWALWPFSFFQAAGYPESLMALMTALTVRWALQRRHWRAAAALGLGILSRHLTLAAGPVLLVAQLRERRVKAVPALLLPWALGALYPLFQWFHWGDPWTWLKARSVWGAPAWFGLVQYVQGDASEAKLHVYVALALVPTLGALLLLRKREWWELAGYGTTLMLTVWAIGLMGLGRYTGAAWPAFLPLGAWLSKRPVLLLSCAGVFAALQGFAIYLFSHAYPLL